MIGKLTRVLFIYSVGSKLGLMNKSKKIIDGFELRGIRVQPLFFVNKRSLVEEVAVWILLNVKAISRIICCKNQLIFARFAYYFAFIYIVAGIFKREMQLEVNSNVFGEFKGRSQIIRGLISELVLGMAVRIAQRTHVVSKELYYHYQRRFPKGRYVFNPNFVVDESCYASDVIRSQERFVNVCFLGNTSQSWHGISLFVENVVVNNYWFRENCKLHLIGNCSEETRLCIVGNGVEDIVKIHGYLSGEAKKRLLMRMHIGISGFNLKAIGLSETTGMKVGEYLFCGLAVILGYRDPSISEGVVFCRNVEIDDPNVISSVNDFIDFVRRNPSVHDDAREYAKSQLTVDRYIEKILDR